EGGEVEHVDDIAGRWVDDVAAEIGVPNSRIERQSRVEAERSAARAGDKRVVAVARQQRGRAGTADQGIVAATATPEDVAGRAALDVVAERRAKDVLEI